MGSMPTDSQRKALDLCRDLPVTPRNLQKVGNATSPEDARWAFEQWDLRKRARAKFARAEEMLFVREALEQATHEAVAQYHAACFPAGEFVADLTTGIGADLIALAARGECAGYELDPQRAEMAEWNLRVHSLGAPILVGDCLVEAPGVEPDYIFADPARRLDGRRTLNLDEFAPHPAQIMEKFGAVRRGVMKLTPMLADETLQRLGPRLEFVSFGGECREALVLFGSDVESGRLAVNVETGERVPAGGDPEVTDVPQEFLYDADPALVRAHAVGTIAHAYGLRVLGDSRGYLTGPHRVESPWLRPYRVLHHRNADPKATRAFLRSIDAATPELKQRGTGFDLVAERTKYRLDGKRSVSLVLWAVGRSVRHMIVERL